MGGEVTCPCCFLPVFNRRGIHTRSYRGFEVSRASFANSGGLSILDCVGNVPSRSHGSCARNGNELSEHSVYRRVHGNRQPDKRHVSGHYWFSPHHRRCDKPQRYGTFDIQRCAALGKHRYVKRAGNIGGERLSEWRRCRRNPRQHTSRDLLTRHRCYQKR